MIYISIAVRNNPSRPSAFSQNIEFLSNSNLDHSDNGNELISALES
ncbi:hypothetical protein [Methanobrevibacter sp.]